MTCRLLVSALALSLAAGALRADSTPEGRAAWRRAADNKIYAQRLVHQLKAGHPELLVKVGMVARQPEHRTPR